MPGQIQAGVYRGSHLQAQASAAGERTGGAGAPDGGPGQAGDALARHLQAQEELIGAGGTKTA